MRVLNAKPIPFLEIGVIRKGNGDEPLPSIQKAMRALVFISVPWSGPERKSRQVFQDAVAELEANHKQLGIAYFRLDVDEDETSQKWLSAMGFPELTIQGAGSTLWLQNGKVLASEVHACSIGPSGIVARTISIWR